MRAFAVVAITLTAAACTQESSAPSVDQGPGSGLDADFLDGNDAADFAPASGLATGAIAPDQTRRLGAFTDVARGRKATVDYGELGGFGPTSEYAKEGFWRTTTFPSTMTLDLGTALFVDQVSFESHWRGDERYIPAHSGEGAYVLSLSEDAVTWIDLPAVAPVGGDHFVHVVERGPIRYVRLKVVAPNVIGNAVHVTMFRVLTYQEGEATRIDARRTYFADGTGPFCIFANACPTGWSDHGQAGFLMSKAAPFPYTRGGSFDANWDWAHPRVCCR